MGVGGWLDGWVGGGGLRAGMGGGGGAGVGRGFWAQFVTPGCDHGLSRWRPGYNLSGILPTQAPSPLGWKV